MKNKNGILKPLAILLIVVVLGFFYFRNSMTGNVVYESKNIYEKYCEEAGFSIGKAYDNNGKAYIICVNDEFDKCEIRDFYEGICTFGKDE